MASNVRNNLLAGLGSSGSGPSTGGGFMSSIAPFVSAINPLVGGLMGLFGHGQSQQHLQDQVDSNNDQMQSNPYASIGPSGAFNFSGGAAGVSEGASGDMFRQLMMMQAPGLFGGGLFNDPNFQQAFSNNDMAGALNLSNILNSTQLNAGGFDTSGQIANMFDMGAGNLAQAGDTSGLVQQNLDASRALAKPFEDQLRNRFNNQEFMSTRGATSGANERQMNMIDSLFRADQNRVLGAQQLGQADQQFLGNLGMAQMGQGFSGMDQNFGRFNAALRGNQGAGNQRLMNAMSLFGQGTDLFGSSQDRGLSFQGGLMQQDRSLNDMILGLLGADNSRISAQSGFASANASLAQSMSQNTGGFFDNIIGGLFGG